MGTCCGSDVEEFLASVVQEVLEAAAAAGDEDVAVGCTNASATRLSIQQQQQQQYDGGGVAESAFAALRSDGIGAWCSEAWVCWSARRTMTALCGSCA